MRLGQHAKSAIVANVNTGKIMFAKNPYKRLPPASMTKMMTLLVAMELLEQGKIKGNDHVTISDDAASTKGSRLFLRTDEVLRLDDLLKGIVLVSGNDAAIALAEYVAGSEANFVKLMNNKANILSMRHTHFVNCHGMDHKDHFSCAYDMLILSKALLKYKRILQFSALKSTTIRSKRGRHMLLKNTNTLIGKYRGVDGLKTGTTLKARFCLSVSAQRRDTRVIAIVMGEPTAQKRDQEIVELLNYSLPS